MKKRLYGLLIVLSLVSACGQKATHTPKPTQLREATATSYLSQSPKATATPVPSPTSQSTATPLPSPTPEPNPVNLTYTNHAALEPGPRAWDAGASGCGHVLLEDGVYHMFYTDLTAVGDAAAIGYATAANGLAFTRHEANPSFAAALRPRPPIPIVALAEHDANSILKAAVAGFDTTSVANPVPLLEADTWVLYYSAWPRGSVLELGTAPAIGRTMALSPTGPWTRDVPVLRTGASGEWDAGGVAPASVIPTAEGYVMYYSGYNPSADVWMLGMATSPEGIVWTKYDDPSTTDPPYAESDPVLQLGPPGNRDGHAISGVTVRQADGRWEIFYSAYSVWGSPGAGYASSPDGINWTEYRVNPLAVGGSPVSSILVNGAPYMMHCDDGRHCWACPILLTGKQ